MATDLKKAPVLSDLVKIEPANYLGREAAKFTSADALRPGTVLMGGPAAAEPWDLSDAADIYGILVAEVPEGAAGFGAPVLFNGPAAVNPEALIWAVGATGAQISAGLEFLKAERLIHTREPFTNALYPGQINRVPD
ncbi:MAG: head decoration protein [Deltaproteobacteria bacterium]|jgi:hypothetical protein|nr:head decoration protein [Deltaproteobacteria bacterium]